MPKSNPLHPITVKATQFLEKALEASDLLASYLDLCIDNLDQLTSGEKAELYHLMRCRQPKDPMEAGALAMITQLLVGGKRKKK